MQQAADTDLLPGSPHSPHPLLVATFAALDGARVRWCLLRGERNLCAPAGDIDILVAREDLARVRVAVAELGFTQIPAWGYGSHVSYLTYDEPRDIWIKLDFVTDLAFGPGFSLATGAEEACLLRRTRRGLVAVPADADAFWCLLLHAILDRRGVRPREASELARLSTAACHASPLASAVGQVAPSRWQPRAFVGAAREGRCDELVAAGAALAASWSRRRPIQVWRRRIVNGGWRWAGRLLRMRRRPGVVLTVLGSGRAAVMAQLQRSFYFPVRVVGEGASRRWRIRYHRARGRLVLVQPGAADADITAVVDATHDGAHPRREITAAVWRAYARSWSRCTPSPAGGHAI